MPTEIIKRNPKAKIKAKETKDSKYIQGYAAIFDEVDYDNDIITKGSFKRSIDNQIAQGKVLLLNRHITDGGNVAEAIGTIVEAKEDDIGFYIKAELFDTNAAEEARLQVLKAPNAFGMSIGWKQTPNNRKEKEDGGFIYNEINLKEVTLTIIPAQGGTIGTLSAKEENKIQEQIDKLNQFYIELKNDLDALLKEKESKETDPKLESKDKPEISNSFIKKSAKARMEMIAKLTDV
jgi:HK97 family phage prohead protease